MFSHALRIPFSPNSRLSMGGETALDDRAFVAAAESLGVCLSPTQLDRFRLYEDRLVAWSERVRLVSRGDRGRLKERHFLDCLALVPWLPPEPFRLLDLGSGAGLPGIPIKISRPDVGVDLLESARMKALFLRAVRDDLGVSGLGVIHARAEALARQSEYRGRYRMVVARAVGPLPELWSLAFPFLQPDGALVAFKGPGALREFGKAAPKGVSVHERILCASVPKRERVLVFVEVERESE